ncbi:MAG: hypothetical protein ACP5VE_13620, partial [Chthonomonadales bacterium]
ADFATRFFGHRFRPEQVIEETLAPFTEGSSPSREELQGALAIPLPADLPALRQHPLMRWLEYELGLERKAEQAQGLSYSGQGEALPAGDLGLVADLAGPADRQPLYGLAEPLQPAPDGYGLVLRILELGGDGPEVGLDVGEIGGVVGNEDDIVGCAPWPLGRLRTNPDTEKGDEHGTMIASRFTQVEEAIERNDQYTRFVWEFTNVP